MKKMSRFVTLLLAIALVFSMSAVTLAENQTGTDGDNECIVKLNVASTQTPYATWTFPSEIIINYDSTNGASLAETYKIVCSDAMIKKDQELKFRFKLEGSAVSYVTVQFDDAPLSAAEFAIGNIAPSTVDASEIDSVFAEGDGVWNIPITVWKYTYNTNWSSSSSSSSHVISDLIVAKSTLNFMVEIKTAGAF